MKRLGILMLAVAIVCAGFACYAFAADRELVLVTSSRTEPVTLSQAEIRQLFLGHAVTKNNLQITAVINKSDPLLYEVFLQKVVFMSAYSYERQLVSKVFRSGGQRPPTVTSLDQLGRELDKRPGTVTFMWKENTRKLPNVTVVNDLWHGSID